MARKKPASQPSIPPDSINGGDNATLAKTLAAESAKGPPLWLKIALVVILAICIVAVFLKGALLSPFERQVAMAFIALFGAVILFVGSSATLEGAIGGTKFRFTGSAAIGLAIYFGLYKFVPEPEFRTISFYLEQQDRPLIIDFEATVFIPGINPIHARGHDGEASFQLLSYIGELDRINVSCIGFRMKDNGPFKIHKQRVIVQMVKREDPAPLRPDEMPSEHAIPDMPTLEMVAQPPKVEPKDVTFRYKNSTSKELQLFVFSCSRYYRGKTDGLVPNIPWLIWDFPARNEFLTYDKFQEGTGWFCFFVKNKQPTADGKMYYLGRRNLFQTRLATLVVSETRDSQRRFQAVFEEED